MKYVSIYHANLNYAFLLPEKYEQVIRASYETILDGTRNLAPMRASCSRRAASPST